MSFTPISKWIVLILLASTVAVAITFAGKQIHTLVTNTDIIMLYLVGAVIIAARLGLWAALVYSLVSVSAFNYFFVDPLFSFGVSNPSYWLTFAVMFFACMVISAQAAGLSEKLALSQEREEQAKKMSALKIRNLLLSSLPHDLKTPLSSIIGASDTLLQSGNIHGSPEQELILSINKEALRFSKLIDNILSIARMEEGKLSLNISSYDPAELIGIAVTNCRDIFKKHPLSINIEPNIPFIQVDGLLISQLLQNLLENAARHTPCNTEVTLEIKYNLQDFTITVSDKGPGIPQGRESAIFNKFFTSSNERNSKGAGLGLAICQMIAKAHGGKMYAENSLNGGAHFTCVLPASIIVKDEDMSS